MSEIQDIIKEQFKTLPKIIQDTLLDSHWQEKIRRVVKINNLHIDQGAAIENLVLITMLGIETPEDFVKNAQEYAQVDYDQALAISNQVEREIFSDIRKKLIEATDASGTVAEIDQATNELDKVAADIENAAKSTPASKPSLKEKIPSDYFEKKVAPATAPVINDPYKEPIIDEEPEEVVVIKPAPVPVAPIEIKLEKLPPKPIFNPMPKEISPQNAAPVTPTAKVDPYREPVG